MALRMSGSRRRRCRSGKVRLRDHREAIERLHACRTAAEFGDTRRREQADYFCEQCCGFHLTSKPWGVPA